MSAGPDIDVMLVGRDVDELRRAADEVEGRLREYAGVYGITHSFHGRQGGDAARDPPRGRDARPEPRGPGPSGPSGLLRRGGAADPARTRRHPGDGPLSRGRASLVWATSNRCASGRRRAPRSPSSRSPRSSRDAASRRSAASTAGRSVNVTASVDGSITTAGDVTANLEARILPEVLARHPGVYHSFDGMQAEQADSVAGLRTGFAIAMLAVFALLAVPPPVLRATVDHHERDPVRPRGRGDRPHAARRHRELHHDVRSRGAVRRRRQRQPGDGVLHQPESRDPRRPAHRHP